MSEPALTTRHHNRIADLHGDITAWRRDLHMHPEIGFEETRTAAIVAEKLKAFGVDQIITGMATTGVVGIIKGSQPGPMVGLRADMDALPMQEHGDVEWISLNPG